MPMPDGKVKGKWSRDDGQPDGDHWQQCESQRRPIIEESVPVQIDDPAFFLPCFHTGRAEVSAAQFHVAQGAQESAAMIARDDSLFLRMVKAARLVIDQCLPLFSWTQAVIKGGEYINLDRRLTGWTWDEIGGVIVPRKNWRMTVCASDFFHSASSN
jgi:hypothetical protein